MSDAVVTATAPVRICDCGGWTDTWFARHGFVFHISVEPRVHVRVEVRARVRDAAPVILEADNFGDAYAFAPGTRPWGRHALLEAAVESVGVPADRAIRVRAWSDVPPGASTGTSASVTVALIGALRASFGLSTSPLEIATAAHRAETVVLGRQAGVQDQFAAAFGGVNFLTIPEYPRVDVQSLPVSDRLAAALDDRLMLVYLGRSHDSSDVHRAVIRDVEASGPLHPALAGLREAAVLARDAVLAGDIEALARAMLFNTEAQRRLHPMLIGADATAVITEASRHGVAAWKVNGAGGGGGSITLLLGGADAEPRRELATALEASVPGARVLPTGISRQGLRIERPGP